MNGKNRFNRRDFMKISIGAIGGLITAMIGIPAIAFIIGPALKRDSARSRVRLGSTKKVEMGIPTLFKTKITRETGWVTTEQDIMVYVLTEDGREYTAMSNVCTHLACRVRWISDQEKFRCPCHDAAYAKDGSVLWGPQPRALDQFDVELEDGQIFIMVT